MADIKLYGTLHNVTGDPAVRANEIYDETQEKYQSAINADILEAIGTNGSVDQRIANAIAAEATRAEAAEGDLDGTKADKATTLEGYGITDAYTKGQIDNMVSPQHDYITVSTYADLANISEHTAGCVYRVSNYDGVNSQVDATKYSEYGWDGTQYVHLATKSQIGEVFDVSEYNATGGTLATYASLEALLSDANLSTIIPVGVRKGGMSIKFIQGSAQSSDNKYVQYRLMSKSWSVNTADWSICSDTILIESPEYIKVYTDKKYRILWGIKTDGTIYFGAGVPPQVVDYINNKIAELSLDEYEDIVDFLNGLEEGENTLQQLLKLKVDKVEGKGLSTNDFTNKEKSVVDMTTIENNAEFIKVLADIYNTIIESYSEDSKDIHLCVHLHKDLNVDGDFNGVSANLRNLFLEKISINNTELETISNEEYIYALVDKKNKIVFGIQQDGDFVISNSSYILHLIEEVIERYSNKSDNIISRNAYKESAVVQSFYQGRNNPKEKNFVFCWGSDFHGTTQSLRNMFLYVENYNNILFSLNTGDTQAASPLDENILAHASEGITKPILNVIGNHDNGFGTDISKMASTELKYQRYIQPFLRNAKIVQPADLSDNPCYYYKDFVDFGIRLIVVDMYNAPKITYDGGTKIANQDAPCISEKQANFIGNALLTLPNDYSVIIAGHVADELSTSIVSGNFTDPTVTNNNIDCGVAMDSPVISDLVNKFMAKERLQKTYNYVGSVYDALSDNSLPTSFSLDIDFSERENSEFICYLFGHQHKDIVAKYDTDLLGLYVINGGTASRDQSFSDIARKSSGLTQDCFNIVSINRNDKKVSLVRIGADVTLDFTKRDYVSLSY